MLELQFQKTVLECLDPVLREVRSGEQTQEIKLPDGMPDIGRVLCAWGQPIARSKEWQGDRAAFSGGMLVWVLYEAEDGSGQYCLDSWIPFQLHWDLPERSREGQLRVRCQRRFVDARSVSPRKIMIRAGMIALAEVYSPMEAQVYTPKKEEEAVQLKLSRYPVRLPVKMGEKTFQMDEDMTLPSSAPQPESLLYYTVTPRVSDKKVMGNKLVFRGTGEVHMLYRSEEGQYHSWDFSLPFSQYIGLDEEYGPDAQADLWISPTALELELDEEGHLHLKTAMAAEFLVTDQKLVEVVEDAYSLGRELEVSLEELELPVMLEKRWETLYAEQTIPAEANLAADVSMNVDFPQQNRMGESVEVIVPGNFQVLYYAENGTVQSASGRWEGKLKQEADPHSDIVALPQPGPEPQVMAGNGSIIAKAEIPLELTAAARQKIPMVTGLKLGEKIPADPLRPSLILQRSGESDLWDLARRNGSTVEAIRSANHLTGEPLPGQMLLIPVK